jgi:hypothetical protein
VTAIQPVMSSEGSLPLALSVGSDFSTPLPSYNPSSFAATGAERDAATWDSADWTGGSQILKSWYSQGAIGMNFAARVRVSTKAQPVKWYATNYMYKNGGLL